MSMKTLALATSLACVDAVHESNKVAAVVSSDGSITVEEPRPASLLEHETKAETMSKEECECCEKYGGEREMFLCRDPGTSPSIAAKNPATGHHKNNVEINQCNNSDEARSQWCYYLYDKRPVMIGGLHGSRANCCNNNDDGFIYYVYDEGIEKSTRQLSDTDWLIRSMCQNRDDNGVIPVCIDGATEMSEKEVAEIRLNREKIMCKESGCCEEVYSGSGDYKCLDKDSGRLSPARNCWYKDGLNYEFNSVEDIYMQYLLSDYNEHLPPANRSTVHKTLLEMGLKEDEVDQGLDEFIKVVNEMQNNPRAVDPTDQRLFNLGFPPICPKP